MLLHEIERSQRVFIDANIFVYHFSQSSGFNKSCTDFLSKVESNELRGFSSASTVQEATHRLMMTEASSIVDAEIKNLPKYLKQKPDIAKQLIKHHAVPRKIAELHVEVIPLTLKLIEESQVFKSEYGFLSNDAISLNIMKELGISAIASNDSDFKRVSWLTVYLPYHAAV